MAGSGLCQPDIQRSQQRGESHLPSSPVSSWGFVSALWVSTVVGAERPPLRVHPDFAVKHLYAVPQAEQGSWISLACDRQGVMYSSDQKGSLYRLVPGDVGTRVELPIGGIHGLAMVGGDSLYAVVGEPDTCPPGLYRLRDDDGDGKLDETQLLRELPGRGEHGPHAVIGTGDGQSLFVLAGNATELPPITRNRLSHMPDGNSLLLPLPAQMGSELRGRSHGGWICRTDLDGREWELIACGLRNAYSLAANAAGELFTADSDTEFEYGLPWYRPNRLLHCVSGADFGWRSGGIKGRETAIDVVPAAASLGAGSPTAVVGGGGAFQYPQRYRTGMFVGDWSQGRLLFVELSETGATYQGRAEEIVVGTPLPIAAGCISPRDGRLYFVTGGRNTQSDVYRLEYRDARE